MSESEWNLDYSYLVPPREAQEILHEEYYIKHNEGVKGTRKIYEFVNFDTFETNGIKEIEAECKKLKIQLPDDWSRSDFLKMQYCGKFKVKESIKKLQTHIQWRRFKHNIFSIEIQFQLFKKKGIVYIHGRDKQYRPIVILNAHLIDLKNDSKETIIHALSFLLRIVKSQTMIPGKVENWIFILETNRVGVFGLPLKALGVIIECMSVNFCGCLEKMYLLNPSGGLEFMWNAISAFIDPETKEKINFINQKTMDRIKERINADQLEKKYGGTRDNLTKFWPPINVDLPTGYPVKKVVNPQIIQMDVEKKVVSPQLEKVTTPKIEEKKRSVSREKVTTPKMEEKKSISPQQENVTTPRKVEEKKSPQVQMEQEEDDKQKIYQQGLHEEDDHIDQRYPETPKLVVVERNNSETNIERFPQNQQIAIEHSQQQSQQQNEVQVDNMDIQESQKLQEVISDRNVSHSQGNGTSAYVTFGKVSRSFVEQSQNIQQSGMVIQKQVNVDSIQQLESVKFLQNQEEQEEEQMSQKTPSEVRGELPIIEGEQASIKPGCCAQGDCKIF